MQNSCKTIIENIEKIDRFDGMKLWKFGGIFTFYIAALKRRMSSSLKCRMSTSPSLNPAYPKMVLNLI